LARKPENWGTIQEEPKGGQLQKIGVKIQTRRLSGTTDEVGMEIWGGRKRPQKRKMQREFQKDGFKKGKKTKRGKNSLKDPRFPG